MRKYFFISLILILAHVVNSSPIDTNLAKQVGTTFLNKVNQNKNQKSIPDLHLVHQEASLQKSENQNVYFYVYNLSNQGFIIVSADDRVEPILGYSLQGDFDLNNIPPALSEMLKVYKNTIDYVITNNIPAGAEITQSWQDLISGNIPTRKSSSVDPLIETRWGQSGRKYSSVFYELYNNMCPYDTDKSELTLTGCVATAMAQIMRYWKYPSIGMGSHFYTHTKYGPLYADFESVHYDYDSMPVQLNNLSTTGQIDAVATVMYQCGVSVDMKYGVDGSSSSLLEWTKGARSGEYALKTNFGFYNAKGIKKENYTESQWVAILKTELNESRPVLYRGESSSGGHAFICDGYDANNKFHMNWGWEGYLDGYFTITSLNPGTSSYNNNQGAIIGVQPLGVEITPDANNIIYVTTTGSGDSSGSSWANATPYLSLAMTRVANKPLKIWVQAGTYYGDTSQATAFNVGAGNAVYGGFKGNEPANYDLSWRDISNNQTILDGQGVQQVVYLAEPAVGTTICDGFTIQNGYTSGGFEYGAGVLMQDSTLLINCTVKNNKTIGANAYGAGVYALGGKIVNCFIHDNIVENASGGGGLCIKQGEKATVVNSIIYNNEGKFGAGILAWGSGDFINTNIVNNIASTSGGGLYGNGEGAVCKFTNCIIWGNKLKANSNQIRFGSTTAVVNYCAIEGGYTGSNNIDINKENNGSNPSEKYVNFLNPTNGEYKLVEGSVCIDAGDPNVTYLGDINFDISGTARIKGGNIDIGAYEYGCVYLTSIYDSICQGEIYDLHGFNIQTDSAGLFVYSKMLGTYGDCDSVLQLNLKVMPTYKTQFTIRMAGSYSWNDSVYTKNGTYQQLFVALNGCDSVVTLHYTNTTSIQDYEANRDVLIYPNPSTDYIHIQFSEDISVSYNARIYDITGKLQASYELNNTSNRIDVSNLAKGIYYIQLQRENTFLRTSKF
ncbi:MAG: T9SS type A sorting domain-containing protein, partial [Bacteroidales bacterium]|nr:T9SS type A sorting domain-containing protein [Bacteroidales bacterium]